MELHCNYNRKKLDLGKVREYKGCSEKDKEVGERSRREV